MTQTTCPSCQESISPKAFDCPHCGHPVQRPKRGIFGRLIKTAFILFNVLMAVWLFFALGVTGEQLEAVSSDAEAAGTVIGGTIATGIILTFWMIGVVILGALTLLTRPKR